MMSLSRTISFGMRPNSKATTHLHPSHSVAGSSKNGYWLPVSCSLARCKYTGRVPNCSPAKLSWASIDDAVLYDSREDIEPDYVVLLENVVEVINVDIVPLGEDDMTQVSNGVLTARGWLHPFKFLSRQREKIKYEIGGDARAGDHEDFVVDAALDGNLEELELWALPIRFFVQSGKFSDTTILDGLVLRR